MQFNNDIIDVQAQAIIDAADAGGSTPAKFVLMDGTQPVKGGAETTRLAVFDMNTPFGSVVSHAVAVDLPADTVGIADGEPRWGRVMDGDDVFVADLEAGVDFTLNVSLVETGAPVKLLSMNFGSIN